MDRAEIVNLALAYAAAQAAARSAAAKPDEPKRAAKAANAAILGLAAALAQVFPDVIRGQTAQSTDDRTGG